MSVSALQAAKTIYELSGGSRSNLEMNKILYLAHMVYMGKHDGEPLIREQFQAWDYGPVVPAVYHHLKAFGSKPVGNVFHRVPSLPEDAPEYQTLKQAVEGLGDMSPSKLVAVTHRQGGAWYKHYRAGVPNVAIPNKDILREYREKDERQSV